MFPCRTRRWIADVHLMCAVLALGFIVALVQVTLPAGFFTFSCSGVYVQVCTVARFCI